MPSVDQLAWSADVGAATWLAHRLTDRQNRITDIVPSGFGAYARLLHPAEPPALGRPPGPVRWREIAAWSGSELTSVSQFHSVAIPEKPVETAPPWRWPPGPRQGTLTPEDAEVLIGILHTHTRTPESCWFCLGQMYGYEPVAVFANGTRHYNVAKAPEGAHFVTETPMPEEAYVRSKVEVPNHTYLLYRGPIQTALTGYPGRPLNQTANLWWPEDRAWCVGTAPGLLWTYIAGSDELVTRLVTESALEVLQVPVGATVSYIEPWIFHRARAVVDEAFESGSAVLSTSMGTVEVSILRDPELHSMRVETNWRSALHFGGERDGRTWPGAEDVPDIRHEMAGFVASRVVALVGESSPY